MSNLFQTYRDEINGLARIYQHSGGGYPNENIAFRIKDNYLEQARRAHNPKVIGSNPIPATN